MQQRKHQQGPFFQNVNKIKKKWAPPNKKKTKRLAEDQGSMTIQNIWANSKINVKQKETQVFNFSETIRADQQLQDNLILPPPQLNDSYVQHYFVDEQNDFRLQQQIKHDKSQEFQFIQQDIFTQQLSDGQEKRSSLQQKPFSSNMLKFQQMKEIKSIDHLLIEQIQSNGNKREDVIDRHYEFTFPSCKWFQNLGQFINQMIKLLKFQFDQSEWLYKIYQIYLHVIITWISYN